MSEVSINAKLHTLPASEIAKLFKFHSSVVAGSQNGKTTLMNAVFKEMKHSAIFFNSAGLNFINGEYINNFKDLAKRLYDATFNNKVCKVVISPTAHESAKMFKHRVVSWLERIIRMQNEKYARKIYKRLYLIFDEVQFLAKDSKFKDISSDISLMGANKKLYAIYMSQRAQNIPKDLITQSNLFLGNMEEHDRKYLEGKRIFFPDVNSYEFYFWERITGKSRFFLKMVV